MTKWAIKFDDKGKGIPARCLVELNTVMEKYGFNEATIADLRTENLYDRRDAEYKPLEAE